MSRASAPVKGFDYVLGQPVERTPDSWRKAYPASQYTRRVENGETFYSVKRGPIAAEAYANIPEERS